MKNKKYLTLIGISSSLLIGSLNAETTIQCVRWPTPHTIQDALSAMYLRMHYVFQEKLQKYLEHIFKNQKLTDQKSTRILTDKECSEILNYLNKEQLFDYYNKYFSKISSSENNEIQKTDEAVIQRVLNYNSEAKSVLFVGFDQSCFTEGSEIRYNTQNYEKSIFTSAWKEHPGPDYNALKCDFRQYANLLEKFPQLNNFFDYIIVGGQTIGYIPAETWEIFGKLLKNSGLLLFTCMFQEKSISALQSYTIQYEIGSGSFLSEIFLDPNMHRNYIAEVICHFIAQGAGDISAYKCHTEENEHLDTIGYHQELAKKIKLGLKLSQFNNEGKDGEFHFCMRPIDLLVIEKENQ